MCIITTLREQMQKKYWKYEVHLIYLVNPRIPESCSGLFHLILSGHKLSLKEVGEGTKDSNREGTLLAGLFSGSLVG